MMALLLHTVLFKVSSINRILRKLHLDHGPLCMEISAHGRAEQGESSRKGPHHADMKYI